MPRYARQFSDNDIYHIYVRGNNRNLIFKESSDKEKYLTLLANCKEKFGVEIYAYALMDNHLHILIRADKDKLSISMKNIQQFYTAYYNKKYNRIGRVFGSRFNSKACNDNIYLTELVKYIHLNPCRAGLGVGYMNNFTSHMDYCHGSSSICNVSYVLSIFDEDIDNARKIYLDYLEQPYIYSGKDIYL